MLLPFLPMYINIPHSLCNIKFACTRYGVTLYNILDLQNDNTVFISITAVVFYHGDINYYCSYLHFSSSLLHYYWRVEYILNIDYFRRVLMARKSGSLSVHMHRSSSIRPVTWNKLSPHFLFQYHPGNDLRGYNFINR